MAPHGGNSGSKENEKRVSRYMQEIRDIAKAGLSGGARSAAVPTFSLSVFRAVP